MCVASDFEPMWLARPTEIREDCRALVRIRKWYMWFLKATVVCECQGRIKVRVAASAALREDKETETRTDKGRKTRTNLQERTKDMEQA
jgi:hypothetical protein